MKRLQFVRVLMCIFLSGGTMYAVDSVEVTIQVECSGRTGSQVAMRWGQPNYNDYRENEYMTLFTTRCGSGVQTKKLRLLDRNSQFEVQTEGGIETSYFIKVLLADGSFIHLDHRGSPDVQTSGKGFTLSRSSGPNKYGEQNFRVQLQGGMAATAKTVAKSTGNRANAQMALRWGHPDFHDNEYFPSWTVKAGAQQEKTFPLRDNQSEFEIQTEGGEGTGYRLSIWLNFGQGFGMQPSIDITHRLAGMNVTTGSSAGDKFSYGKGNAFGETNVRVTIPALPDNRKISEWNTVYLHKQQGLAGHPIPYIGQLGLGIAPAGQFTMLRSADNYYDVELVGPGGTTDDCFTGNGKTRLVRANQGLPVSDFQFLYGQNPTYPKAFVGCSRNPNAPNFLLIQVFTVPS